MPSGAVGFPLTGASHRWTLHLIWMRKLAMPARPYLDLVENSCAMIEAVQFMLSSLSRLADKVC